MQRDEPRAGSAPAGGGTLAGQVIRGAVEHDGTRVVFASPVEPVDTTLGNLVTDAERMAGGLQAHGIGPGDVVAVQLPSSYEGAVAQTAVALSGAALLPIVLIYGPRELRFILRESGAAALITPGVLQGRDYRDVVARLGPVPGLRMVAVAGGQAPDGMIPFADLAGRLSRRYSRPAVDPGDRALLVYTSGTTAEPKGVQHTHRSLLAEVFSLAMRPDPQRPLRQLALFPSGHVAGLLGLLRMLVHGTPTVVLDAWDPARAAALVDEHRLNYGAGAPIQLAGLLDEQAKGTATLATLREFLTGAAAVPPPLIERADAAGVTAYRCYGSSEHPTISTGTIADPLSKRAGTDGQIIEGSEIRLVDDAGADVPAGADGEIASRGAELFLGYTDPALDRAAFLPDGWFRTGDIGRLDDDGYLTVTDRKKDIIIRGGENISAKEVEDLLAQLPIVAEAAAVGIPDARYGERVCAVVVLRSGDSLGVQEVAAHFAAAGVARQKTPERVIVVGELPRTPAGKVQKHVLRAALAPSSGTPDPRQQPGS